MPASNRYVIVACLSALSTGEAPAPRDLGRIRGRIRALVVGT
jgi:hypothetical protein